MFIRIAPFIRKFSQSPKVSKGLEEEKIKSEWDKIVGSINKSAKGKTEALYVSGGELVVGVRDHIWLQELSFYKQELNKQVAARYSHIKSVRLVSR